MSEQHYLTEPAGPFAVVIDGQAVFGPIADREEAERFAAFAAVEIDPARVCPLLSPVAELLNWRDMMARLERGEDDHPS